MNYLRMFQRILFLSKQLHQISSLSQPSSSKSSLAMKTLIVSKKYQKALDYFFQQSQMCTDYEIYMALKACAQLKKYQDGMTIHQKLSSQSLDNPLIQTSLIQFYAKCGDVHNAYRLFSTITKKTSHIYTSMFRGLTLNNMSNKVLDLFNQMLIKPDEYILNVMFNACGRLSDDRAKIIGMKLLNEMPEHFRMNPILMNAVIDMLMRFGNVAKAEDTFQLIKKKTIITYGAMIKGYSRNNMYDEALDIFEQIPFKLNDIIFIIVFNICAQLSNDRAKTIGMKLLNEMPEHFRMNPILMNAIIDMFVKFGEVEKAEDAFQSMKKKDIITYGAMMKGYTHNNMYDKSLNLFEQTPLKLNDIIYSIVFKTCAQLSNDRAKNIGIKLLNEMPEHLQMNTVLMNTVIVMFMKFGDVPKAEDTFQLMKKKDIITYAAMMNGYNTNDEPLKSLKLFDKMKEQGLVPNTAICIILIGACARIGMIKKCLSIINQLSIHSYDNSHICTALIDMWGKVGLIKNAQEIFQSIKKPDVIAYTSMINAFGRNRMGLEAVDLYHKMPKNLLDEVTHVCVLNACSHVGIINEAHSIFNQITDKTKTITTIMIDCLSRVFLFDEAQKLIDDYEKCNSPYSTMYMAMLSGARTARSSVLSEKIYTRMKVLFPSEKDVLISGSILLHNIYLSIGDHQQAERIRLNRLKEFGSRVKVGKSWTEIDGDIVEFTAHDDLHPRSNEIYAELKRLSTELVEHGHVYDASWITRQINEGETVESVLCGHSEKLAIAFNFIQETKPSFIQVTKNLRVCGDCHQATKLIAKIRKCTIIVRDANCIHYFSPDGNCSCQDHF